MKRCRSVLKGKATALLHLKNENHFHESWMITTDPNSPGGCYRAKNRPYGIDFLIETAENRIWLFDNRICENDLTCVPNRVSLGYCACWSLATNTDALPNWRARCAYIRACFLVYCSRIERNSVSYLWKFSNLENRFKLLK